MRLLVAVLVVSQMSYGAIGNRAAAEINASGNANAGGWFNPSNANMLTDFATDTNTANTTAPVISSASYNFVAGDVGNWFFVKAGTSWYGTSYTNYGCWYPIASVATNKATLNAAVGAGVCADVNGGMPSPRWTASTVAGVSASATVTGGTGGVDYSQVTGSLSNGTDLASSNGTTNPCAITSATYTFRNIDVGNTVRISAGTSWTTGWYEIVSVSGGAATLDRACGSAASISSGTFRIAGAFAFGGGNDDAFLETATATNGTGGGRIFAKAGTHAPNGAVSIAAVGGTQAPISIEGYNALRGDAPTGSSRPEITFSTNALTLATAWDLYNLRINGTAASLVTLGAGGKVVNCQIVNLSTTANRNALVPAADVTILNSEFVSLRGKGINVSVGSGRLIGNYFHSSDTGLMISVGGNTPWGIQDNLFEDNTTYALNISTVALTMLVNISGNTFAGASTAKGTGINIGITGTTDMIVLNNIIWGFVTGFSSTDTQTLFFVDYNDYFGNTTARSSIYAGSHDAALDPQFTSVGYVSGTAGAFTAGNDRLVDTSKDFSALGVVPGRDYLLISSGSGYSPGGSSAPMFFPITSIATTTNSNDTLVLGVAPGTNTTTDKVYHVVTGRNYAIGTNLKALGFGGFQGGYTTSYVDIGGAQRQETGGGGGGTRIY